VFVVAPEESGFLVSIPRRAMLARADRISVPSIIVSAIRGV
jgi:hypothetical protein